MRRLALVMLIGLAACGPARACGFGEAPGDCGDAPESSARYLLSRVVRAVKADEGKALAKFAKGEDGFRTVDEYVFCVGPDGVMSAHPNAALQGQDVRELHDKTGNYFIATMLKEAKADEVAQIRYLFPRPGGTEAVPKLTYYTRAADQVCGVGVYEGEDAPAAAVSTQAHLVELRTRLNAGMPPALRNDWTAFLETLDAENKSRLEAFAKVRDQVHAAESVLTIEGAR